MRTTTLVALVLPLSACSVLEQINFGGSSLDPNKVYLDRASVISVAPRETYRYACVDQPLLCVQRGVDFECHCQ